MNIYYTLWEKQLPVIAVQMKNAKNGEKVIQLQKHEFESMGMRKLSDYTFNLEINNGKIVKSVTKGTAIAKDLYDKLVSNENIKELLVERRYKINMGKSFLMKIKIIEPVIVPIEETPATETEV